jgi:hypothetical protein
MNIQLNPCPCCKKEPRYVFKQVGVLKFTHIECTPCMISTKIKGKLFDFDGVVEEWNVKMRI